MKKIVLSTMGALFMTALMLSCDQSKETGITPTNAKAQEEPLSVIDQMEKEEGIKFFKRDVTLTDKTTGNKILMRVAAKNNDLLEQHLTTFEYSVTTLLRNDMRPAKEAISLSSVFKGNRISSTTPELHSGIMTEILNTQISGEAVGYSIKVSPKEIKATNGKVLAGSTYWEHTSMNWPERIDISVENGALGVRSIDVGLEKKDRWYDSWHPYAAWTQFSSNPTSTKYYNDIDIDGPWRVMARVYYDPIAGPGLRKGFTIDFRNL